MGVKAGGGGGATSRANEGVPMGATADVNAAITENYDREAGANRATGVASSGAVGAGIIGATSKSTTTNAVVSMNAVCTTLSTGTAIHADKTDETQIVISLPSTMANLSKKLYNNSIHKQCHILAHIHIFLLQDSPNITQLNDALKKHSCG